MRCWTRTGCSTGTDRRVLVRLAGLAVLLSTLLLGPPLAHADDLTERKRQIDAEVEQLRADLTETSEELAEAVVALRRAELELPGARSAAAKSRGELAAAQAREAGLEARLKEAQADVVRAENELAAVLVDIDSSRDLVGGIARNAYQNGRSSELSVLLAAESPQELANRLAIVKSTMTSENAALGRLSAARVDLAGQQAALIAERAEIADLEAQAGRQVEKTAAAASAAEAARAEVERLVATSRAATVRIERERGAEERRVAEMEAESQQLQAVLVERARLAREAAERARKEEAARRARAAAEAQAREAAAAAEREAEVRAAAVARAAAEDTERSEPEPEPEPEVEIEREVMSNAVGGDLLPPVSGYLTSSFGMRTHPVTGVYKLHDGTDYGAGCGTPIRAAGAGEVIWATDKGGYGNQVAIDHGMVDGVNLVTSYSHLSRFAVGSGADVDRGEVIGYVGTTGYSTGCHLHLMVYEDGGVVDPMTWF